MRIFIGGVACVGKTTIGARLADFLKRRFYDLDAETERFFGASIERLQNSHLVPNGFRRDVAKALQHVLSLEESRNGVIALSPRGLMGPCWNVVQKAQDTVIIVLDDTPENILERVTFYDIDSRKIDKTLSDDERLLSLLIDDAVRTSLNNLVLEKKRDDRLAAGNEAVRFFARCSRNPHDH